MIKKQMTIEEAFTALHGKKKLYEDIDRDVTRNTCECLIDFTPAELTQEFFGDEVPTTIEELCSIDETERNDPKFTGDWYVTLPDNERVIVKYFFANDPASDYPDSIDCLLDGGFGVQLANGQYVYLSTYGEIDQYVITPIPVANEEELTQKICANSSIHSYTKDDHEIGIDDCIEACNGNKEAGNILYDWLYNEDALYDDPDDALSTSNILDLCDACTNQAKRLIVAHAIGEDIFDDDDNGDEDDDL